MTSLRVERAETKDASNVWVVGNDDECLVIDAPLDVEPVLSVVGGRHVVAIVCTHSHPEVAPQLGERIGAPVLAEDDLAEADAIEVGGTMLEVLPVSEHGDVCLYAPALGCAFTGEEVDEATLPLPVDTVVHPSHGAEPSVETFGDRDD